MLRDIKITKAIQNERNELVVSFLVKREDYNEVDAELLKQAKITGNMLDIEFMGLRVVDGQEERSKKLQMLGGLMSSYAEKSHLKLDSLLSELYKRHSIVSRTELSDSALDCEIDSYIAGLKEYN